MGQANLQKRYVSLLGSLDYLDWGKSAGLCCFPYLVISPPVRNHWNKQVEMFIYTALLARRGSGRAARQKWYIKGLTRNLLCSWGSCCQTVLDPVRLTHFIPIDQTTGKKWKERPSSQVIIYLWWNPMLPLWIFPWCWCPSTWLVNTISPFSCP